MLLFPPAHSPTLNYRMRGGDTARYADRLRFAQAGNVSAAYKKDEWVTIIYQRAPLREKIKSVYIQIYPHRVEYTFNFIFNRRPVTMKVDHETLKKWNEPKPPPAKIMPNPDKKKKPRKRAALRGLDALLAAIPIMLRLENERDVIPTGDLCQAPDASQSQKNRPNFNAARVSLVPIPEMTERQRIAHEKFLAFMEHLDKPRYTRAELYDYITNRLTLIKERQIA